MLMFERVGSNSGSENNLLAVKESRPTDGGDGAGDALVEEAAGQLIPLLLRDHPVHRQLLHVQQQHPGVDALAPLTRRVDVFALSTPVKGCIWAVFWI